jgi:hypothetical protein
MSAKLKRLAGTLMAASARLLRTVLVVLAVALPLFAFAGCNHRDAPQPVTRAEAEARLQAVVAQSRQGDLLALCQSTGGGDSYCTNAVRNNGSSETPPSADPTIVGARPLAGGMVLELRGNDAGGKPFSNDFYVVRNGNHLDAPYPVWWVDLTVGPGHPVTPNP